MIFIHKGLYYCTHQINEILLHEWKAKNNLNDFQNNISIEAENCGIICIRCILTPQFFIANLNFINFDPTISYSEIRQTPRLFKAPIF